MWDPSFTVCVAVCLYRAGVLGQRNLLNEDNELEIAYKSQQELNR